MEWSSLPQEALRTKEGFLRSRRVSPVLLVCHSIFVSSLRNLSSNVHLCCFCILHRPPFRFSLHAQLDGLNPRSNDLLASTSPLPPLSPDSPPMVVVTQRLHDNRALIAPYYTLHILSATLLSGLLLVFALRPKKTHPTLISVRSCLLHLPPSSSDSCSLATNSSSSLSSSIARSTV